jgi:predicted DNA-binding transcriptional regulator AlpA
MKETPQSTKVEPSMAGKYLSPEDLAGRYGVALQTVYGWNKSGGGPAYLKIGGLVRYRLADVEAWEASRTVERGRVEPAPPIR